MDHFRTMSKFDVSTYRIRLLGKGGRGIELTDYTGQDVDDLLLHEALDFMISLEPDYESPTAMEDYQAAIAVKHIEVTNATAIMRKYGEQIRPLTLERMQEVFYLITNSVRYRGDSVVRSSLNAAWDGIEGWRK